MAFDSTDFDYASATVPPDALFVAADEPLLVFPSTAAAEQYLEAVDVRNGVYLAAYGPNGECYQVGSDGDHVFIEPSPEPDSPEELRTLLIGYLEAIGHVPDATATLASLVTTVWETESSFWREHDPYGDRFGRRIPLSGCIGFVTVVAVALYFAFAWA